MEKHSIPRVVNVLRQGCTLQRYFVLVKVSQIDITVEQHHIALGYTGFLPET